MTNLRRVAFLASLVIGGGVGYCWYVLSVQAESIIAALAPYAKIHYDYLRVSPLGWVSIENVEISAPVLADKVVIDAVVMEPLNLFGLLNVARSLRREEWPKTLRLRVKNASFDLYGAAFKQRNIIPTYDSMGCNDVAVTNLDALRGMGYRALRFDGVVQYNVDEFTHRLSANAGVEAGSLATLALKADLQVSAARSFLQMRLVPPQLAYVELVLQDQSFNHQKSGLCARKIGITPEAFLAENTLQAARMMRTRGMTFSQDWLTAYGSYIATRGRMVITATLKKPLPLPELPTLAPAELLDKLKLAVQVNDQPVPDVSVTFHAPEPLEPAPDLAATSPTTALPPTGPGGGPTFLTLPNTGSPAPSETAPPPAAEPQTTDPPTSSSAPADWFTLIPPAQRAFQTSSVGLAAYIDRVVVVTMADGRQHQGQLKSVGSRDLQLMMQIQRGTVGFSIAYDGIKEVRVLP